MEKLNAQQIEQFLRIEKEVDHSADHAAMANGGKFYGDDDDSVSSMTITTGMTTTTGIFG